MNVGNHLPAIVVAAYNRVNSLQRLLHSLELAVYPEEQVKLVISIDQSQNDDVVKLAEKFEWKQGEKKILRQPTHIGLKEHILHCGDLTAEYGSILLLEDDLLVSKYYYNYAIQSLNFYADDSRIAGISLYSYDISENGPNPFSPVDDGADVYFMQVASSWGQAWTASQWNDFRNWFRQHPFMTKEELPPAYLLNWHENSWKKHFIRYLHFNDRFFVFPRVSLTTNFEDPGATADRKGLYQVPLLQAYRDFKFVKLDDSKSCYDSSFEMRADCLKKWYPLLQDFDFTVDLYGIMPLSHCQTSYLLTTKKANDEVLSFSLEMFPPVLNIINGLEGKQIKLARKENVSPENVPADTSYYKLKPVSDIIYQAELVQRVEKVYATYSKKIDALHQTYTEKIERLHEEIRRLHRDYHAQITKLHDDYAVKIKSAVDESLKAYQFNLDFPQFAIVTLVKPEHFERALLTARSVAQQDYPRIHHLTLITGSSYELNLSSLSSLKNCTVQTYEDITDALQAAADHFNRADSDLHCWLEAGTVLLPKALLTARDIFRRFVEVNWLKGLPVTMGEKGEYVPAARDIDFRWDKYKFYESTLAETGYLLSSAGIFWKQHLWEKAGGRFSSDFPHIADIEYFNRLFTNNWLYVAMANLAAAKSGYQPSAEALNEFNMLKKSFPKTSGMNKLVGSLSFPFFKRNIPVLRTIHKLQRSYPPLIRFDFNSQSFYLSEY